MYTECTPFSIHLTLIGVQRRHQPGREKEGFLEEEINELISEGHKKLTQGRVYQNKGVALLTLME